METRVCKKCLVEKPANSNFFTKAKICLNGIAHICCDCKKIYLQAYRDKNKEKLNSLQREYRKRPDRKERHRLDMAQYRKENPDKTKAVAKRAYDKHGAKYNLQRKEKYNTDSEYRQKRKDQEIKYRESGGRKKRYLANREILIQRSRNYRLKNIDKIKIYNDKYREENKEYLKTLWKKNRIEISPSYIAGSMRKSVKDLSPDVIQTKRLIIFLKRELGISNAKKY